MWRQNRGICISKYQQNSPHYICCDQMQVKRVCYRPLDRWWMNGIYRIFLDPFPIVKHKELSILPTRDLLGKYFCSTSAKKSGNWPHLWTFALLLFCREMTNGLVLGVMQQIFDHSFFIFEYDFLVNKLRYKC